MPVPTNNSEQYLAGKAESSRLSFILDELQRITAAFSALVNTSYNSDFPVGATPFAVSSGLKANAQAQVIIPPVVGKTFYLTGFEVTGSGATAGLPVTVTVQDLLGGTLLYSYCAAVGALVSNQPLIVQYNQPLPARLPNQSVTITCPALGTANTQNMIAAHGYYL